MFDVCVLMEFGDEARKSLALCKASRLLITIQHQIELRTTKSLRYACKYEDKKNIIQCHYKSNHKYRKTTPNSTQLCAESKLNTNSVIKDFSNFLLYLRSQVNEIKRQLKHL